MADLSRTPSLRGTTQERITNNRDRLIQTARTEQDGIRPQADQRDAATGDGRADAIRRALGMASQAVDATGQVIMAQQRQNDAAKGAADGLTGAMDPGRAKHQAYADAYYSANAVATQVGWQTTTGEALDQLVNDPTKSPADIEAAFTRLSAERVKAVKEQYGASPAAQAAASKSLIEWTAQVQPKLRAAVKDRADAQTLDDTATVLAADIAAGKPVDWSGTTDRLAAGGIDRSKVQDRLFQLAMTAATNPDDPHPEIARDATKAMTPARDGHPAQAYFSPQQISQLRNAQLQADSLRDKKEKDDQKLAMTNFEDDVIKRQDRNFMPALVKLRDTGKITLDQFNDVSSTLTRAFSAQEEGFVDQKAYLDLKRMTITPNPNWSAIQSAARKANLGTGFAAERARLEILSDAAQGIRSDQARAEARANARAGAPRMGFMEQNNYQAGYAILSSVAPPKDASIAEQTAYFQAVAAYRNKAEANPGQDHIKAATDAIDTYTKTKHSVAAARTYAARSQGNVTPAAPGQAVTPADMKSFLDGSSGSKAPAGGAQYDESGNRIR